MRMPMLEIGQGGCVVRWACFGLIGLICGCRADKVSNPTLTRPLFPIHQTEPDCSRQGVIAYRDNGVVAVGEVGPYSVPYAVDTTLAGIWVLDPETGESRRVDPYGRAPDWSPDGTRLAFVRETDIYTARADGTDRRQLTFGNRNFFPDWGPDGRWIAYDSNAADPAKPFRIWLMAPDGTQKQDISRTDGGGWRQPCWHPLGGRIVHLRFVDVLPEVFVMDSSGLNGQQLTWNDQEERYPEFSPDGKRILFTVLESESLSQLWMMNADGSDLEQLTTEGGSHGSWMPDGRRIVYQQANNWENAPGNNVLWMLDVETGERRQLTRRWDLQSAVLRESVPRRH